MKLWKSHELLFKLYLAQEIMSSITALTVSGTIDGLSNSLTLSSAVDLLATSVTKSHRLPHVAKLLEFGGFGIRDALTKSCKEWTIETVSMVRQFCQANIRLQLLFFSRRCISSLKRRLKEHRLDELLRYSGDKRTLAIVAQLEHIDPHGQWWFALTLTVDKMRLYSAPQIYNPLLRMSIVDVLYDQSHIFEALSIYSVLLAASEGFPTRGILPLFALMHIRSIIPRISVTQWISEKIVLFYSTIPSDTKESAFGRMVVLWICSFTGQRCHQNGLDFMFNSLIGKVTANFIGQDNHLIVNSLILIVFGCSKFGEAEKQVLTSRIACLLPKLDDLDLSNFLWLAYLAPPFKFDQDGVMKLITAPDVHKRLMNIPPYRQEGLVSLLQDTKQFRYYFRRWMTRFITSELLCQLVTATEDDELFLILSQIPLGYSLPLSTLGGLPILERLKHLLQGLLDRSPALFATYMVDGDRNRVWIHLRDSENMTLDSMQTQLGLVQLLLRINTYYEDEPLQSPTIGKSYDLCLETIQQLESIEQVKVPSALFTVYPDYPGEDTRSIICYI